jgi:hypothetical protein
MKEGDALCPMLCGDCRWRSITGQVEPGEAKATVFAFHPETKSAQTFSFSKMTICAISLIISVVRSSQATLLGVLRNATGPIDGRFPSFSRNQVTFGKLSTSLIVQIVVE